MTGPIRPEDVARTKSHSIPDAVFDVFNQLIARGWNGRSSVVVQDEVVDLLTTTYGMNRADIFAQNMLDVEEAYRGKGWKVVYDKPAYNESYPAKFEFSKPQ
jgi:hypothetical protein